MLSLAFAALAIGQRSAPIVIVQPAASATTLRAITDVEPMLRVRGIKRGVGLSRMAFAQWLRIRPDLWRHDAAFGNRLRSRSNATALLNASSSLFRRADRDANNLISATELADLLSTGTFAPTDEPSEPGKSAAKAP